MKIVRPVIPALAGLCLALSLYEHLRTGNAGDKNWLLLAAQMWLNGKKLYVDIFEINPPLILFIYSMPAYVALHVAHITDVSALSLLGFLETFVVIALSLQLIRRHPQFAENPLLRKQFVCLLLFIFVFCTANNFFFDREYILLSLTFPYMLRFMPWLGRTVLPLWLTLTIGVLAGIGFCIKPHAVIIFAVIQFAWMMRHRSLAILRSSENILIYGLTAAYLFYIWHFTPEYLSTVLPMALATYGGYGGSGLVYLAVNFMIFGVSFVDFRPRPRSPFKADIYYLLLVSGAYLAYALLNNGWGYTYYPLTSMGLFVTGWVYWDHRYLLKSAPAPAKSSVFGSRACAVNLGCNFAYALLGVLGFFMSSACDTNLECRKYSMLMREIKERHIRTFGVMSNDFSKWTQVARASGASWQTRFNHLWMLKKFVSSGPDFAAKNHWVLEYLDAAYTDDLNRNRPDAVFIVTNFGVKLPDFFGVSEGFKEAWSHYRFVHTLDVCGRVPARTIANPDCHYDVFERFH